MNLTSVYYAELLRYLFTVYDLYFLLYQFLLIISPKVRFSEKILIVSFVNKIYRTNFINIFIPLIGLTFQRRSRIIIYIIFFLHMDPISIITVFSKM